ncbi:MAG TPA: hypothetical protein VIG33_02860 [Pseudobdellovibrionaceae bacterium]
MALLDLVQKSKKQSSLLSHHGQAVVEYVLMLVVSVAMVMALGYQIFKPFQAFLKSYMGDYIQCLLETGELPALGNPDSQALLEDASCNAQFQAATLSGGRPSKSANSANPNQELQSKSASESSSSQGGGGGGGSGPSPSSRGGNLLVSSMKKKNATESKGGLDNKVTEISLAEKSQFYNRKNSYSSDAALLAAKTTQVGIAGMTEDEKRKQERKEESRRTVASGENMGPPLKKIPIKKPEVKTSGEIEDPPFTFGNFLKFLLIAAIVIALIVVIGSQVLKVIKSQEK